MAAALLPSQRMAFATATRPPQATCTPCTPSTSSPSSAAAWRHQRHHGRMQMHGMPAMRIAAPSHGASIRRFASSNAGSAAAGEEAAEGQPQPQPPVVEASAVVEAGTAAAQGPAAGAAAGPQESAEPSQGVWVDEYEQAVEELIPSAPLSTVLLLAQGYGALAVAHAVVGVTFIASAFLAPQLLLSASVLDGSGRVLLGCVGAGALRTAGLLQFLTEGVLLQELCTWRQQRVNALLLAASAGAALASLLGALQASPLLSLVVLGLSLPTAAVTALSIKEGLACGELFSWSVDWSQPLVTLKTLGNCLLRDISTLPGLLLLVLLANQAAGFAAVLTTGLLSPAALVASFQMKAGAVLALRHLAGSGALVLAAAAHTLLDFAPTTGRNDSLGLVKSVFQTQVLTVDRLESVITPPKSRFVYVNVMTLLAALAQAALLLQVHAWSANVNIDASLWGPLYGGTALSLLYCAALLVNAGWQQLADAAAWTLSLFMQLAATLVDKFVFPWDWQTRVKR